MNDVLKELLAASVSIEARICSQKMVKDNFGDILPRFSVAINAAIGELCKCADDYVLSIAHGDPAHDPAEQ